MHFSLYLFTEVWTDFLAFKVRITVKEAGWSTNKS